jgi:hypothetical protein
MAILSDWRNMDSLGGDRPGIDNECDRAAEQRQPVVVA